MAEPKVIELEFPDELSPEDIAAQNAALEQLINGLNEGAYRYFHDKDAGRAGATLALFRVLQFLGTYDGFPGISLEQLCAPLLALVDALIALDLGVVRPMLKPAKKTGRAPNSLLRSLIEAASIHTVDRLCELGLAQADAEKRVAAVLDKAGLKPSRGGNVEKISQRTIKSWRQRQSIDTARAKSLTQLYKTLSNRADRYPDVKNSRLIELVLESLAAVVGLFRAADI